jgi:hypothetical protein
VIVLVSNVTAAVWANALPSSIARVLNTTEATAIMVPAMLAPPSIVAELPTAQKMLDALARLIRITLRPPKTVRVDAIWEDEDRIRIALGVESEVARRYRERGDAGFIDTSS